MMDDVRYVTSDATADTGDACASMDIRVDSVGDDTATVSFLSPTNASEVRVEYSTGKFPTQDNVEVREGSRASHVITGLDPGETYAVVVWHDSMRCTVDVSTKASRGHDCALEEGVDYRGHDMVFGHGGYEAARRLDVLSASACCDACAAVKPNRPYNDVCTHFVYEMDTHTCYFKAPADEQGGGLGRENRAGYVAGKVIPR